MAENEMAIEIDADLGRRASRVAEYYGLDLPSVMRAFCKQMVDTESIPLDLTPRGRPQPMASEEEAMQVADAVAGEMLESEDLHDGIRRDIIREGAKEYGLIPDDAKDATELDDETLDILGLTSEEVAASQDDWKSGFERRN